MAYLTELATNYKRPYSKPDIAHMQMLKRSSSLTSEYSSEHSQYSMTFNATDDLPLSHKTKELNSLTVEEREQAMFDMHGVSIGQDADPANVEQLLEQMKKKLETVHTKIHPGLAIAMEQDIEYVMNERIKFLRADRYDPNEAADRMGKYFSMKKDHFSDETLGRDLTLQDIPSSDWGHWTKGFGQVLREKDTSGRVVFFYFGRLYPSCPPDVAIRYLLYSLSLAAQEEAAQKAGMVAVDFSLGFEGEEVQTLKERMTYRGQHWSLFRNISTCTPLRIVARHYCFNPIAVQEPEEVLMIPAPAYLTVRSTFHFGTPAEIINRLITYGIHRDSIPINEIDGAINTEFHTKYLESLIEKEGLPAPAPMPAVTPFESLSLHSGLSLSSHESDRLVRPKSMEFESGVVSTPTMTRATMVNDIAIAAFQSKKNESFAAGDIVWTLGQKDVVMGRGHHNRSHPGNLYYRHVLDQYKEKYHSANRVEKMTLGDEIMARIYENGSRFVSLEETQEGGMRGYKVEPLERARYKMTHDLRNMKRSNRSKR
ncbi:MAG: hypothetical protein SGILL_005780 [Bacillariaceae sp.]